MRFPAEISLRPARRTIALLAVVHCAALAALFPFAAAGWPRMLAALCMAASLFHALRDEWRKRAARILLHEDGGIGVEGHAVFHGAMWAPRAVDLDWAVWLQLTVVYARPAFFRRRWLMLLPGNMTPRQWRVLRIWLRHKAAKARAEESG